MFNLLLIVVSIVSGEWSPWGAWSSCTRTCGGGQQTRSRICRGGAGCEGLSSQSQRCNTDECIVQGITYVLNETFLVI